MREQSYLDRAKLNPARTFKTPMDVVETGDIDAATKLAVPRPGKPMNERCCAPKTKAWVEGSTRIFTRCKRLSTISSNELCWTGATACRRASRAPVRLCRCREAQGIPAASWVYPRAKDRGASIAGLWFRPCVAAKAGSSCPRWVIRERGSPSHTTAIARFAPESEHTRLVSPCRLRLLANAVIAASRASRHSRASGGCGYHSLAKDQQQQP